MTNTPHYLRVVLALAATAACSAAERNAPTDDTSTTTPNDDRLVAPTERVAIHTEDAAAPDAAGLENEDASTPHTSGPIVPPELA